MANIQQGIDIVDENLNIVYINPAFEKIMYAGKEWRGVRSNLIPAVPLSLLRCSHLT